MRKPKHYLDQFYTVDKKSGDFLIEIKLKEYDDIFNNWDSSLYNVRDLDSSLKSFISDCSKDIDLSRNVGLRFHLSKEHPDLDKEETIREGIHNYYEYLQFVERKNITFKRRQAFLFMLISSVFIIGSFYLRNATDLALFQHFLLESITVGSWIFMWEAFYMLFINSRDELRKQKEYKRLIRAPILYSYD
ncbi:hypothetical protein [Pontibacillus salipaludis]|uniref:hypothetical protein n=1 Tax=Pontibacillus salipaludis TaxID=1697394 RepID=UPI0031EBA2D7